MLLTGDIAAFLLFGFIGLASHEESVTASIVARSLLPFPIAWMMIAPNVGALDPRARIPGVLGVWVVAGVIALVARSVLFDRELFNAFFVISLFGNGLFLAIWRVIYGRWLAPSADARTSR